MVVTIGGPSGSSSSLTVGTVRTTAVAAVSGTINRYDATSGALAPAAPAVGAAGTIYAARKTDATANAVTIGGETLVGQGDEVTFVSDGTAWVSGGVRTTRATQSGTYARIPSYTVVLAGDSWTSQVDETDSVVSPPQQWWSIQGYWAHAQQATRARWTVLAQAGLLGDTCTGLEARIPAQVLSYAPGVVVDLIGTNDVIAGATAATIIASDARRIATYRAAGIDAVVIGTIPPQNGNSAGKKSVIAAVNASRRDRARSTPGIYLWDVNSTLVDPATGEFRSDCQSDGTHPSVKGAALSGQLLGRVLNAIRSTPESDGTAGTATDTSQYLANPAMTGASTPPTGWSIYDIAGSSVYTQSLVARTDDLGGQFWQIAMTSGSLLIYQIVTMAAAGLAVGDPIYGLAEFETNAGATPTDFWMQIGHRDASTFYDYNYDFRTITSWAGAGAYLPRYGLFRTRRQPIAAGSDRIEVGFRMGGALTVRLGRTALVKGGVGR